MFYTPDQTRILKEMAITSYRAPLLWILIPMISGYIMGYHFSNFPIIPTFLFAIFVVYLAYWTHRKSTHSRWEKFWPILFFAGVSAASLLYFQQSRKFPEIWEVLPPREANLQLKIKQLYASSDPTQVKGIAKIVNAENHLRGLVDYPIFFSIAVDDQQIDRGNILSARGVLTYLPSKETLSLFEQYLYGQSISLTINRAYLTDPPEAGTLFEGLISKLRRTAIESLGVQMQEYPEELSIYRGMTLGIKSELSTENKELFLKTGTLHLFAISGLHVGIIAVSWAGIFLVLRVPRQIAMILGLGLVYLYVEITGASPSAVRAFAMIAFFWAGKSVVRQMPPFQALVASAVTVLLIAPTQLFASGFQLSYTVVTGILLWGIPLFQTLRDSWNSPTQQKQQYQSHFRKILNKIRELVVGTFCISLSATLASAPLSILYFGLLAPFAVILNMILVPLASLVIISGLFSLITGFLQLTMLAGFFNQGPRILILMTNQLLEWIVKSPSAYVSMAWTQEWLGYTTVFLFLGSLLVGYGLRLGKIWRFTIPVVLTAGMILLNSLIRSF